LKIKCVLIGLGQIGMGYDFNSKKKINLSHSTFLKNSKNFKLIAGIDKDLKKKKKFENKYKIKSIKNINDLNINDDVDLFIIATPSKTHFEIIKKIYHFKKPILIEKPLTDNITDIKNIKNIVKKKKIKIFVNYFRNYDLYIQKIFEKIKKKNFFCHINYSSTLLGNGSHHLTLVHKLLIGKKKISILNNNLKNKIAPDFKIKLSKGEIMMIKNRPSNYRVDNIHIYLKNKKILINLNPFFIKFYNQIKDPFYENEYLLKNISKKNLSNPNKYMKYTYNKILKFFENKKYSNRELFDILNVEKLLHKIIKKNR